ncbi:MAG: hypothetical protein JXA10_16200 [Anaerolineae bacterium]|nr:hypothetical protein [Anaerolineae bacterium]
MSETYNWRILQNGDLPLQPNGDIHVLVEHRCSAVLVWPENSEPSAENTILVDPCFTAAGYDHALGELARLKITFRDIGRYLITHLHGDHMLHLPSGLVGVQLRPLRPPVNEGLALESLPGHHDIQLGLTLTDTEGRAVWIVGDAILGEDWLRAWQYYWPNGYTAAEIVETWRSVARIMAQAELVIPGHAAPFAVTPDLIRDLIAAFPRARHADQCPDVRQTLQTRLASFEGD